ncbi:MAG: BrnT family toxin [Acidobacteriaceae bacterium]
MTIFRWNQQKNERLKTDRGVSFEDVVLAIESGGLLDVVEHPNSKRYPNQGVYVVVIASYVYLVPHIEEPEYIFLKTIIPSRKATRDYGMKERTNHEIS